MIWVKQDCRLMGLQIPPW